MLSGEKTKAVTQLVCPARVAIGLPEVASQSRAVLSSEPVRTRVPSGEKATAVTEAVCPARVAIGLPEAASQSRAVLSREPVRTRVPSGEKTTAVTEFVCRRKLPSHPTLSASSAMHHRERA